MRNYHRSVTMDLLLSLSGLLELVEDLIETFSSEGIASFEFELYAGAVVVLYNIRFFFHRGN